VIKTIRLTYGVNHPSQNSVRLTNRIFEKRDNAVKGMNEMTNGYKLNQNPKTKNIINR